MCSSRSLREGHTSELGSLWEWLVSVYHSYHQSGVADKYNGEEPSFYHSYRSSFTSYLLIHVAQINFPWWLAGVASVEQQGDEQASLLCLVILKHSLSEVLTASSPVSAAAEDAGDIHLKPYYQCLPKAPNFGAVGNLWKRLSVMEGDPWGSHINHHHSVLPRSPMHTNYCLGSHRCNLILSSPGFVW